MHKNVATTCTIPVQKGGSFSAVTWKDRRSWDSNPRSVGIPMLESLTFQDTVIFGHPRLYALHRTLARHMGEKLMTTMPLLKQHQN